ncbi:MAG: hypothetical protein RR277_08515 [Rikenellaceae bacterium]
MDRRTLNQCGTIVDSYGRGVSVYFDNNIEGHSCNGVCATGHGWEMLNIGVELISEDEDRAISADGLEELL